MVEISSDVLIYDCETQVFGKPDPSKDILKIFGFAVPIILMRKASVPVSSSLQS